jgi:hypothetical protein
MVSRQTRNGWSPTNEPGSPPCFHSRVIVRSEMPPLSNSISAGIFEVKQHFAYTKTKIA